VTLRATLQWSGGEGSSMRRVTTGFTVTVAGCVIAAGTGVAAAESTTDQVLSRLASSRDRDGCTALARSAPLDAAAGGLLTVGVVDKHGYPGTTRPVVAEGATVAEAVNQALSMGDFTNRDCRNTDLGIAMAPTATTTKIALVFGSITGPQIAGGS
jgi:hypothetical protein